MYHSHFFERSSNFKHGYRVAAQQVTTITINKKKKETERIKESQ